MSAAKLKEAEANGLVWKLSPAQTNGWWQLRVMKWWPVWGPKGKLGGFIICFYDHPPKIGEDVHFDEHVFQRGLKPPRK